MLLNTHVCIILLVYLSVCADCQLCTKRDVVTRWSLQSYEYTYRTTYWDSCFFRRCRKSRVSVAVNNRRVPIKEIKITNTCCDGYIRDDDNLENSIISCRPICMPSCINGNCTGPGLCQCYDGYTPDINNSHSCRPVCGDGCIHGTCTAPYYCECNFGYTNRNGTCQPICTEPCVNGTCIAPDTCKCLTGYRKTESNACAPYCSKGCTHGTCTRPEVCTCDTGYVMDFVAGECLPKCDLACRNSTCVAPNVCKCFPGYEYEMKRYINVTTHTEICVPICNNCKGSCVAPNTCVCDDCLDTTSTYEDDVTPTESTMYGYLSRTVISLGNVLVSPAPVNISDTNQSQYDASDDEESNDFDYNNKNETYASDSLNFNNTVRSVKKVEDRSLPGWIYGLIFIIVVMIVILIVILTIKRKSIANTCGGTGSYVVEDYKAKDEYAPSQSYDVIFSRKIKQGENEFRK